MADVKIADLLAATTVNNNDLFVVEDNADTKKITYSNLKSNMYNNPTFTGVVTASQIKFPATQVPSADPNTLDDYEEGTFSPTFAFISSANYTALEGRYTKIGNIVYFRLRVAWNNLVSSDVTAINLPFVVGENIFGSCSITCSDITFSGQISAMTISGLPYVYVYTFASNGSLVNKAQEANGTYWISGHYAV